MEHVWVEGWIDYIPSRGAVHKQGDTWIPLDASYKQYTYTEGISGLQTAVPFDAQSFLDQVKSTATVNEAGGYVTNIDSNYIQTTLTGYQAQLQNHLNQILPNATVWDILGKKEIIKKEHPYLLGTLPYKVAVKGSKYSQIPINLRSTLTFSISDQYGLENSLTYTTSLPEIAGKKITLSYSPATSNDEAVIKSLIPKPHADGSPIQPGELPTSFPAYLINLKPELRIDGSLVATGSSIGMGQSQTFTMTFNDAGIGAENIVNNVTAGEYYGIGLDLGKMPSVQASKLKAKIEATAAKMQANDVATLAKDDIIGDFLHATIATYFAEIDAMDFVVSKTSGVVHQRLPSGGMFFLSLGVNTIFGVPVSTSPSGFIMDVDRILSVNIAKDGDTEKAKEFTKTSGVISSLMENNVPEQLMNTTTQKSFEGISAVKAITLANEQGMKIFQIDQSNYNSVIPNLSVGSAILSEIGNAINAGKKVYVHERPINFYGKSIVGYIIENPIDGSGAYKVSSGTNGADIETLTPEGRDLVTLFGFIGFFSTGAVALLVAAGVTLTPLAIFLSVVAVALAIFQLIWLLIDFINGINTSQLSPDEQAKLKTFVIALTVLSIAFTAIGVVAVPITAMGYALYCLGISVFMTYILGKFIEP